jgi:RNA methyltransferase, TrmH family
MVVGVFRKYTCKLASTANHVVLDRPQYPGNVGAIARTILAFGFADLAIIRPAAEVLDPESVRASMGAAFGVRSEYFANLEDYQAGHPRPIYPFVVTGGRPVTEVTFRPPLSVLFGNEGSGLPEAICSCRPCVSIPQSHNVDSLNVAVAVGIALYEVSRRSIPEDFPRSTR